MTQAADQILADVAKISDDITKVQSEIQSALASAGVDDPSVTAAVSKLDDVTKALDGVANPTPAAPAVEGGTTGA